MASGHAARQWLEAFKFSVYIITPIGATIFLGTGAYPYLERMIANVCLPLLSISLLSTIYVLFVST